MPGFNAKKQSLLLKIAFLLLLTFLIVINLLFILECDELYFTAWRFDSVLSRILSKPIQDKDYVIGIMKNGRLLGNFLGVLNTELMTSSVWWLRAPLFVAGLVILSALICKICAGQNRLWEFLLAFCLISCANKEIYANVYSWGVAYINYVLPVIGFAFVYWMLESSTKPNIVAAVLLFAVSFTSQLYMETFTISMILYAVFIVFGRYAEIYKISTAAGYFLGAVLMFASPNYRAVASGTAIYSVGISFNKIIENCSAIFYDCYLNNVLILFLITLCLFAKAIHSSKHRKLTACLLFVFSILSEIVPLICRALNFYAVMVSVLCAVLFVCSWLLFLVLTEDTECRKFVFLNLVIGGISVAPLVMVQNGLSDRMYFECYVALAIILVKLLPEQAFLWKIIKKIMLPGAFIWLIVLSYVYYRNFSANEMRLEIGEAAIAAGQSEITLPVVPYPTFATNETTGKKDYSFILYRDEPFDVELNFIPYEEYMAGSDIQ